MNIYYHICHCMKFEYDFYLETLLTTGIFALIIGITFFSGFIKSISSFKKITVNASKLKKAFIVIYIAFLLLGSLGLLSSSASQFYFGIKLKKENPSEALILQGEIEKIEAVQTPTKHAYKNAYSHISGDLTINNKSSNYAHFLTINEKKYYIMVKGDLKVGDNVEIIYLPKSSVILEINFVESQNN